MAESIPRKQDELIKFAKNFKEKIVADFAGFGLSAEDAAEIDEVFGEASEAFTDNKTKQTAARAAKQLKDIKIKKLLSVLRRQAGITRFQPGVTSAKIVSLGLRVRDEILTPVSAPDSAPLFRIDISSRLWHRIKFWEEGSERLRRKPKGVIGVDIYLKLDGADADFKLHTFTARSPHTVKFEAEDVGKQAHYYLRWVTRRGDRSAMSQTHSATIAG